MNWLLYGRLGNFVSTDLKDSQLGIQIEKPFRTLPPELTPDGEQEEAEERGGQQGFDNCEDPPAWIGGRVFGVALEGRSVHGGDEAVAKEFCLSPAIVRPGDGVSKVSL